MSHLPPLFRTVINRQPLFLVDVLIYCEYDVRTTVDVVIIRVKI